MAPNTNDVRQKSKPISASLPASTHLETLAIISAAKPIEPIYQNTRPTIISTNQNEIANNNNNQFSNDHHHHHQEPNNHRTEPVSKNSEKSKIQIQIENRKLDDDDENRAKIDKHEEDPDKIERGIIISNDSPDGGYGWIVVFASFMCNFTVDGICYTFGLFLPHFMAQFASGKAVTALAGSLLSGCYMTAGLFVSGLVNRFGCRSVAIIGSIIAAISLATSTIVPNVYTLIVTYGVITGAFFGLIYLPSIVSVGYWFTSKRALATGIAVCGSGMGAFSFAPLVSALLDAYEWQTSLRILAVLALTCAIYGMLMRPVEVSSKTDKRTSKSADKRSCDRTKTDIENLDISKQNGDGSSNSISKNCHKSSAGQNAVLFDFSILKIPAMALLSIANIFGMTGYYIPYVYIAGYAEQHVLVGDRLATTNEAAMLLSAIGISNVLGRIIFGVLVDRAAGKRVYGCSRIKISALLVNNCCLLSTAIATIAISFCSTYASAMIACIIFGFSISSYMSLTSIILVDLLGLERLSTTFGWIIFFRGISSIVGPPLAGLLYEFTDSYGSMFVAAGLLILISSLTHAIVHRYEK